MDGQEKGSRCSEYEADANVFMGVAIYVLDDDCEEENQGDEGNVEDQ